MSDASAADLVVCWKHYQAAWSAAPTAPDSEQYVTKPFSPRELTARVKAALRRLQGSTGMPSGTMLAFRRIRVDKPGRHAWVDDRLLELTAMKFDLLRTLAEHHGQVLSREQLLEKVGNKCL
jgi:DNA-binding response OmpR family regulator